MSMMRSPLSLRLLFLAIFFGNASGACQSCLVDMTVTGVFGHSASRGRGAKGSHSPSGISLQKLHTASDSAISTGARLFDSPVIRFLLLRKLIAVAYDNIAISDNASVAIPMTKHTTSARIKSRWAGGLFVEELSESDDPLQKELDKMGDKPADSETEDGAEEVMSAGMIMAIGFYKEWISPLLPPACRFLPTCSQYGAQAIKEFGPQKGLILTAWRLARCSPLGGRGYDPPKWPPVAYTYGSY